MTQPNRLYQSSQLSAARELLAAGMRDRPKYGAANRVASRLGLSAAALTTLAAATANAALTSSAASAGISAAAGVAGGSSGNAASASLLALAGKWFALGLIGGASIVGGATYVASVAAPPPVRPAVAAVPNAEVASAPRVIRSTTVREQLAPVATAAASESSRAPNVELAPAMPSSSTSPSPPSELEPTPALDSTSGALGRELALVDQARQALLAGDATRALGSLHDFARVDSTHTLDREAELLRIQALAARGQHAEAARLARSYVESYPNDPRAAQLRSLSLPPAGASYP